MLALPAPAAAIAQDDAGTGADAPNDLFAAVAIPVGDFGGTIDEPGGDWADWYRIPVPDGWGAQVRLHSDEVRLRLNLARPDGGFMASGEPGPGPEFRVEFVVGQIFGDLVIGVEALEPTTGAYHVHVTLLEPADLRLADLRIDPMPVETDAGPLPLRTQSRVAVTIENLGPGFAIWGGVSVSAEHYLGNTRQIGGTGFESLAPGQSRTYEFIWDGTGETGDVTIVADVGHALELDPKNNRMTRQSHVLVGNVGGVGADAGNLGVGPCDPAACAHVWTGFQPWGRGVWYEWYAAAVPTWGIGHVGAHPNEIHTTFDAAADNGSASVFAGVRNGSPFASVCYGFQEEGEPYSPECAGLGDNSTG